MVLVLLLLSCFPILGVFEFSWWSFFPIWELSKHEQKHPCTRKILPLKTLDVLCSFCCLSKSQEPQRPHFYYIFFKPVDHKNILDRLFISTSGCHVSSRSNLVVRPFFGQELTSAMAKSGYRVSFAEPPRADPKPKGNGLGPDKRATVAVGWRKTWGPPLFCWLKRSENPNKKHKGQNDTQGDQFTRGAEEEMPGPMFGPAAIDLQHLIHLLTMLQSSKSSQCSKVKQEMATGRTNVFGLVIETVLVYKKLRSFSSNKCNLVYIMLTVNFHFNL